MLQETNTISSNDARTQAGTDKRTLASSLYSPQISTVVYEMSKWSMKSFGRGDGCVVGKKTHKKHR